jgi:hypothetical protein
VYGLIAVPAAAGAWGEEAGGEQQEHGDVRVSRRARMAVPSR